MQCPRCQQDNHVADAQFCPRCGAPVTNTTATEGSYADLRAEIKALRRSLGESLEQQTATSELLKVIGQSTFDLQPVFETLAENASRLCEAERAFVYRFDGRLLRVVATHNVSAELRAFVEAYPNAPGRQGGSARAALERRTIHIVDAETEPDYKFHPHLRTDPVRTVLAVPMLRGDELLGVIFIYRHEVRPFTDSQIALMETFSDQAAIAIENARLFTELQARNRELTEALEQRTATSEILRVISASPTDVQPVFDAIVQSAVRLCNGVFGMVVRYDGHIARLVAHHNLPPDGLRALQRLFPGLPASDSAPGRALLSRTVVHVHDQANSEEFTPTVASAAGFRTNIAVPMLRDEQPIGAIAVARREVEPFSEAEIELLKTFADQAVIAIENVRLFTELQTSNRELTTALDRQTATSEILRVISRSQTDVQPVFDAIVRSSTQLCEGVHGVVLRYDGELMHLVAEHGFPPESLEELQRIFPQRAGRDLMGGRAITERRVIHIADLDRDPTAPSDSVAIARIGGYKSLLAVPIMRAREPIGCIVVSRGQEAFSDAQIELVKTFADQAVIAIENVRLFKELEVANRELAAASQHKSEFLANMSHELRTPLNAIIGFSEVLSDRMFGELNEKQEEYLKDIYASGTHLLSLINDILDLSKIEAGRMELELTDFDLPTALDNALMLVRERAQRRSLTLDKNVDAAIGQIKGDERKIRQVVLNLLSNAIKFTPEGGRIELAAVPKDGLVEVSVSDTGVGIAPEDQEKVFEEFRQVGTADKKAEGTGLGLTLCRKFIELHGGKIWVKSQVGVGSTFTFTVPVHHGE